MATDPVRSIQRRNIGHGYNLALDGAIAKFASMEPASETPYLTTTVDWTPEGVRTVRTSGEPPNRSQQRPAEADISGLSRPARFELQKAATELASTYEPRSPARASIEADIERLFAFL